MSEIVSPKNPKIKAAIKLRESRQRRRQSLFLVEGEREFTRALESSYSFKEVFYVKSQLSEDVQRLLDKLPVNQYEVHPDAFAKLAMREGTCGIVGVAETQSLELKDLSFDQKTVPLLLATEGVEKPGNLGAMLRTAESAGVTAVVILDQIVDIYNPNCIRASLGGVFAVPVIQSTAKEFKAFCQQNQIAMAAASPFADRFYFEEDFSRPAAIVMGSEAHGLSECWENEELVKIPMQGICDSLNVSVAAAILVYEAVRQRMS